MPRLSSDEKWRRFNQKLEEQINRNDFCELGITYYEMADFLQKEGKDASPVKQKGYEMKLMFEKHQLDEYNKSGVVRRVEVLGAGDDSCVACKAVNRKEFTMEEATANPPIPIRECTHKYGCRCCFLPIATHQ